MKTSILVTITIATLSLLVPVHAGDFQLAKELPDRGEMTLKSESASGSLARIRFGEKNAKGEKNQLGPIEVVFLKKEPTALKKNTEHKNLSLAVKSGKQTYTIRLTGVSMAAGARIPDKSATGAIIEPVDTPKVPIPSKTDTAGLVEPVMTRRQVIDYRTIQVAVMDGKIERVLFEAKK